MSDVRPNDAAIGPRTPERASASNMSTPEELRSEILKDIDAILGAPWIVQRFISEDYRRLLRAERNFWQADDTTQLVKLLTLFQREP